MLDQPAFNRARLKAEKLIDSKVLAQPASKWTRAALGLVLFERTEHHQRIDISKFWVMKGLRQAANDLKAQGFPQRHGACVGADDEVELDAAIATQPRIIQGVVVQRAGDPAPHRSSGRHVTTVANVLAAAALIGADVISADDLAVFFSDEGFPIVPKQ